jgi:hypothetical protein
MKDSVVSSIKETKRSRPATTDGGTSPLFAIDPVDLPSLRMCDSHPRPSPPSWEHSRCTSWNSSASFVVIASFRAKASVVGAHLLPEHFSRFDPKVRHFSRYCDGHAPQCA